MQLPGQRLRAELPPGSVYPSAAADPLSRVDTSNKAVVLLDTAGSVLRAFVSQSKAATALGLSPPQVSFAVRGGNIIKVFPTDKVK